MIFDNSVLFDSYKSMMLTCILDGYLLPVLIRDYPVPLEYKYTLEELNKLYSQVSVKNKRKYEDMVRYHREMELLILKYLDFFRQF